MAAFDGLREDVRDALRAVRRQPGVAAAAVLTLGVGIGATTASFGVVKAVLLDPLPYPRPDTLVRIVHQIGGIEQSYFNDPITLTYLDHTRAFASLGVWAPSGQGATITGSGEPEDVRVLTANRELFATLGVAPIRGRWFSAEEDTPGGRDAVLISEGYWRRRLGSAPDVIGRVLTVDGRPHEVVGVMPEGFRVDADADVMLPLRLDRSRPSPVFRLNGIARMRPGIALADANADIARMLEIYFDTFRVNTARTTRWVPALVPLKQDVVGDVGPTLWIVLGAVALALLMACANVANLLLVRGESRRRELAIRAALGARPARLARAQLVESLVLALGGGGLGLALAMAGVRALRTAGPAGLPRLGEIAIDPEVVAAAIALAVGSALLFSLLPIVRQRRTRVAAAIDVGARGASLTRERQRAQHVLVAAQIALTLVLLVGASLMLRSIQALRRLDPGFVRPETVQVFNVSIPDTVIAEPAALVQAQRNLLDRVAAIPGVTAAAFTTRLPTDHSDRWSAAVAAEDIPPDGRTPPNRQVKVVSPGVFQTLGTPLVAGRDFTWTDFDQVRAIAIVSENLARELWGSAEAALGKRIRPFYGPPGPWQEIVGVAGDVHDDGAHVAAPPTVYWPARLAAEQIDGYAPRRVSVMLRTERAGTEGLLAELRGAVRSVNGSFALADVRTLARLYRESMARTAFTLATLGAAAAIALLLGVSGIYGVIAYAVAQRRREIGIRLALGARAGQVRGLFLRRGLAVVAVGVAVGLAAAIGGVRLMESVLFGITPFDPLTFLVVPVVLAVAALVATYVPARQALAIDPVETMKAE